MDGKEYLVMDDAGNISEEDFTREMNAAAENYLKQLDEQKEVRPSVITLGRLHL